MMLHGAGASAESISRAATWLPVVGVAALYLRGVRRLRLRAAPRVPRVGASGRFGLGVLALAVAILSPLHEMAEASLTAHMVQHELLMCVAAPLLTIDREFTVVRLGCPAVPRALLDACARTRVWRAATQPTSALLIHVTAIWAWHAPRVFELAVDNVWVHAAQHAAFLGSALLFWHAIWHPRRNAALGLSVLYLFLMTVNTGVLGALMAVAREPWYAGPNWGPGALQDQQAAGLIMWIPGSAAYVAGALLIVRRWLASAERMGARQATATSAVVANHGGTS
jgi:cytochrome c oxidase assembly factor CtaG